MDQPSTRRDRHRVGRLAPHARSGASTEPSGLHRPMHRPWLRPSCRDQTHAHTWTPQPSRFELTSAGVKVEFSGKYRFPEMTNSQRLVPNCMFQKNTADFLENPRSFLNLLPLKPKSVLIALMIRHFQASETSPAPANGAGRTALLDNGAGRASTERGQCGPNGRRPAAHARNARKHAAERAAFVCTMFAAERSTCLVRTGWI